MRNKSDAGAPCFASVGDTDPSPSVILGRIWTLQEHDLTSTFLSLQELLTAWASVILILVCTIVILSRKVKHIEAVEALLGGSLLYFAVEEFARSLVAAFLDFPTVLAVVLHFCFVLCGLFAPVYILKLWDLLLHRPPPPQDDSTEDGNNDDPTEDGNDDSTEGGNDDSTEDGGGGPSEGGGDEVIVQVDLDPDPGRGGRNPSEARVSGVEPSVHGRETIQQGRSYLALLSGMLLMNSFTSRGVLLLLRRSKEFDCQVVDRSVLIPDQWIPDVSSLWDDFFCFFLFFVAFALFLLSSLVGCIIWLVDCVRRCIVKKPEEDDEPAKDV